MEKNFLAELIEFLKSFLFNLLIAILIAFFVFNITTVQGLSMSPTLDDGDRLFTQRVSLYFRNPKVGEIVIFEAPDRTGDIYIKRVIAKEEDEVELREGRVYVNGDSLYEPYLEGEATYPNYPDLKSWQVPQDHYFVMGDNRDSSNDSRSFGPIHQDRIIGISEFRIYPFDEIGNI